jgi:hypothetical protein
MSPQIRHLPSWFRRTSLLALAGAASLSACNELPHRRGESVQTVSSDKLEKKNPVDLVVAPIENKTGSDDVPIASLRDSFQKGLVRRRYSPLALEYVDRKVVDAAYTPGSLKEEAVLQVTVESWDTSLLDTRGALIVKIHARLVDAEDSANGQLWGGFIDHRFDLEAEREQFSTRAALLDYACGKIAEEVLAALPARNAGPGR